MGFRKDAFATVWSVEPVNDSVTKCRISTSRKEKGSDNYVQDFGGFVSFVGTACAKKAARLKERDRIKLGDVDVTNKYDKVKNTTYTNFNVFDFDMQNGSGGGSGSQPAAQVDDGEPSSNLPF